LNTGASINCGSALARNGAVTLQGNTITSCGSKSTAVPEPGTMSFMGMGLLVLVAGARRRLGI
jgi:MYXO-CTERM domain-containing protein